MSDCPICNGDGYTLERHDADSNHKEQCPCMPSQARAKQIYRQQVASGLLDEEIGDSYIASARQLADKGMAQVMGNVQGDDEAEAVEQIYSELLTLAELQPYAFSSDDLRARCEGLISRLHSTNILGALFRRAKREKKITATGQFIKSQLPQSHGRPVTLWRKA